MPWAGSLPRRAAEATSARRSQQAPPSLPSEVTLDQLRAPKQLAVASVLQNLVAIEGILKSFQLHLQTLYTLLQRLQPLLRTNFWRSRPRRSVARTLRFHFLRPPNPLGGRARGRGNETQRRIRGWPHGSRSVPQAPRLGATNASVAFGLRAEVLLAGPARPPTLLPFSAQNERDRRRQRRAELGPRDSPPRASDAGSGPCCGELTQLFFDGVRAPRDALRSSLYDAGGQRRQRNGFRTRGEARTTLNEQLRRVRLGPLHRPQITLDELVDAYLARSTTWRRRR